MKRLFKYMRGYWKESILGPLLKLCEASLELTVPLIIAAIVDVGIENADVPYTVGMSLVLVLMGALGLGFSVTAQYFCAKAAVGLSHGVRGALFKKAQTFSYSDLDKIGTSTLITRMTADTAKVQNGINLALRLLLRSPFVVFGALVMAFTIDFDSALTFAAVIPALSVVVFGIMLITMPMYKRAQARTDALLGRARENLDGVRVIRAFRKEQEEIHSFKKENGALAKVQGRTGMISSLLNPLTYVLINLATLWLIYVGALKVDAGKLTQGQVVALYNYMAQILIELIKLANLIVSITRALASAGRIADVIDMPSTQSVGTVAEIDREADAVCFSGVSMRYEGASEDSLSNISLSVKRGQTVGIIGGTGSGKTTLVSLIPGLYPIREGSLTVGGVDVSAFDPDYLCSIVATVPQKAVLFRGSVRDNMRWRKADATDEEIWQALKIAQAEYLVREKGGLDAHIEQGGRNLSGGQKQRLTIARALVGNPEILILDDSASALDFATDAELRRSIRNMSGEITTFIVSQRASSIMYADTIIVLDDGEPVGIGSHEQLMSECEIYKEIYYSQFEKTEG